MIIKVIKEDSIVGGVAFVYVAILVVFIIINYFMALRMQDVVEKKGYTDLRVVAMCFWLGIIGYLYVISLPDMEVRRLLKTIKTKYSSKEFDE